MSSSAVALRKHRRAPRYSVVGAFAVLSVLVAAVLVAKWSALRWLVYVAWMVPFVELVFLAAGTFYARFFFRTTDRFRYLIIQITTAGREYDRVCEIIDQIHSYDLSMNYQVWVVLEPGHPSDYPRADRVLVVPADFIARSRFKARALEYSRRVRKSLGYARSDVKIIFNDDDVSLTKSYIETAFAADYDMCEGVVSPRTSYAVRPFGHFLTSHADDIRTHACLVYCSVFQGIFGHPLHVHGEGMTVTGAAESVVTWNDDVDSSEDLVFGHQGVAAGLSWGWFHEYAEVTSPWTLKDFIKQRRRWLWGDLHAIRHRHVLPLSSALLVVGKYAIGIISLVCSVSGLYLRLTGAIPATAGALDYAKLSILAWVLVFFSCGWIGASASTWRRTDDARMLSGVLAVLMMPVSLALTFAAIAIPLIKGDPRGFAVIHKTLETSDVA